MKLSVASFLLAIASYIQPLAAQPPKEKPLSQYTIDRWQQGDDFPVASVESIVQTSDGYLWFGATNGLFRYDGVRFVEFSTKTHSGLRSNRIKVLYEDSKGELWIGTQGGGISILRRGTISAFEPRDSLPSDYVRAILEDRRGDIWIGTDGEGLCRIGKDSTVYYNRKNPALDQRVTSILESQDGSIWVGTFGGLFKFSQGTWTRFGRQEGLSADTIFCMKEVGDAIWIGTYGGGLTKLTKGQFSVVGKNQGLVDRNVTALGGDEEQGVLACTLLGGVSRLYNGEVSSRHVGDPERGEYAIAVLQDRELNVWVGLQSGGLVRLRDATFTWFPSTIGTEKDPVRSVMEDRDGAIWAGTTTGLKKLVGNNLVMMAQLEEKPTNILSVGQDGDGTIWAGTLRNQLRKLIGRRLETFSVNAGAIWSLYRDKSGKIWAGTNVGLFRIDGRKTRAYTYENSKLSHSDVRAICERADGSLWIGTSYGLNQLVGDSFKVFTKRSYGLSNDVIVSLHADDNGDLWIGTLGGLNRLRDTTFISFTMRDGLPDDAVGMILEDDKGFFWITGDKGLYRIAKSTLNDYAGGKLSTLSVVSFGREDGLLDPGLAGTIQPAAWKSRDGRVWIATNSGLAMANPAAMKLNAAPPTVVIEHITVDRVQVDEDSLDGLPYYLNQIEIAYTAPSFFKSDKINFQYRLNGLSGDWIEAGDRRRAYFSRVPPGNYTFEVVARSANGEESLESAVLVLTVLPPWWESWWFRGILILGFLSVGPSIYFLRVSRLKQRQKQHQDFALRVLESQESERKRIAGELHDSLGQNIIIIKNRAALAQQAGGDSAALQEQLDEISKTAGTTLDDMRKIAYNLRPLNLERFGLTDTIAQTVEDVGAAAGIQLTHDLANVDKLIPHDLEIHFFRIVQEALNNIVKHSHSSNGAVIVKSEAKGITLIVRDNGVGFDMRQTDLHRGDGGFGFEDIRQRAELMGGSLIINSSRGRGTLLTVSVPKRSQPS
ncbi:MAG TPA: two-component regulator propeller domain-containing protein [Bacteroidota bacterium]